jgi:hypothetical protein
MGSIQTACIFVIVVNVLMFLTQASVLGVADPGDNVTTFYNKENSIIQQFEKDNQEYILDTENIGDKLPAESETVNEETGNIFTDIFQSIKNWIAEKTGLSYAYTILSAPYNMLKAINLPNEFVWAMGTLWYAITLMALILLIFGRE